MSHNTLILVLVLLGQNVIAENLNITSPPVTDWGEWGVFQKCPEESRAQGFQLKTEEYQGMLVDDSALNGVRLFCGDPFNDTTPSITSSVGDNGNWGTVYSCYPGNIVGFQLRVEPFERSGDETATNNMRVFCSQYEDESRFIEGDGLNEFGEWGETMRCAENQGVCGIQTQVEDCSITSMF